MSAKNTKGILLLKISWILKVKHSDTLLFSSNIKDLQYKNAELKLHHIKLTSSQSALHFHF